MSGLRSKAMGRSDEKLENFVTSAEVNIRSGPGTTFNLLTQPLPKGTPVRV